MANNHITTVNHAVHKLQLALLEGINDQNQLLAAGCLMSRSDYEDVVTERSIANMCGYPLCGNSLPSEQPRKGRYRISLKEHKVYDLQETYMYCSPACVVNSRAFSACLPNDRCFTFNFARINEILSMFKDASLDVEEIDVKKGGDLGLSKLTIQENVETKGAQVMSLEEWVGPSDAIEGYVPRWQRNPELLFSLDSKGKGSELSTDNVNEDKSVATKNRGPQTKNVLSITDKRSTVSKNMPHAGKDKQLPSEIKSLPNRTNLKGDLIINDKHAGSKKSLQNASEPKRSSQRKGKGTTFFNMDFMSTIITQDEYIASKAPPVVLKNDTNHKGKESCSDAGDKCKELDIGRSLLDSTTQRNKGTSPDYEIGFAEDKIPSADKQARKNTTRSSLKSSSTIKKDRSVTWADEIRDGASGSNLCEYNEPESMELPYETLTGTDDREDSNRFASANTCALALAQAAEAVASGQSDVADAVSEAGIMLMPQPCDAVESESKSFGEDGPLKSDLVAVKWPKKSNIPEIDAFDTEDSWFDSPPDGFSLTLSPFATMWNAVFTWITSSSLAYIYGKDDSYQEEYLCVNGREYLNRVVLSDGRSAEIKQTMSGCLARALPGVISDLKLATSISTLEQGLACLLDTMSFLEALPPFRMKQWQVLALLFIDALTVWRIPGLGPQLSSKRVSMLKVLEGANMGIIEYESMRDIILPLSGAS